MSANGDEQAFPAPLGWRNGLTKREWFAGMAMAGLLASQRELNPEMLIPEAIDFADDMLKELA